MPETQTPASRPSGPDWLKGIALGAAAGAVILGAGGRLAMRGVAIVQEWTLSFSVGGSTTVVMMGTLAGVTGAVILLALRSIPRLPGLARTVVFWAAAALITWRILQPIDRDRVVMFTPVVLIYGLVQQLSLKRVVGRRPGPC
jgi:hypothetical protein